MFRYFQPTLLDFASCAFVEDCVGGPASAGSACPAAPVDVVSVSYRHVVVKHVRNIIHVDTSACYICSYQNLKINIVSAKL